MEGGGLGQLEALGPLDNLFCHLHRKIETECEEIKVRTISRLSFNSTATEAYHRVRRRGCNAQVRFAHMEAVHRGVFHSDRHAHGCHHAPFLATLALGILALGGVAVAP